MECSALFASFWGLIQSISIFCFGLNAIIGNEDPSGCVCKSVEPGSVYYEILNSFCELSYGARYLVFNTAIPTTLIALVYMILNGLLIHGLIAEKPGFIHGYQIGNFLSTIVRMKLNILSLSMVGIIIFFFSCCFASTASSLVWINLISSFQSKFWDLTWSSKAVIFLPSKIIVFKEDEH